MFPILIPVECLPFSLSLTGFIQMLPGEKTFTLSIKNHPAFVNR